MKDHTKQFPPFSAHELLFHRFNQAMIGQGTAETPFVLLIRVPDASVNRQRPDGVPEDVIH